MNAERERVASSIREAFRGVTLGNGVGLWEGRALDDYDDKRGIASARLRDQRADWSAIPVEDLCECESSLTFADPEGVRFLLPAFMLAELDDKLPAGVVLTLTDHHRQVEHFGALSREQRSAVREFLLVLRDDPKATWREDIDRSLETFWTE
jgi:hypothetical protein